MNTFDEGLILRVLGDAFRLGFILLRNSGKVIKLRRLPLQDGNLPSASHESGNELLNLSISPLGTVRTVVDPENRVGHSVTAKSQNS